MRTVRCLVAVCSIALTLIPCIADAQTPVYGYEIVNTSPHDPSAFTEGLAYVGGALYESTGLYGSSTLRQVDLRTGTVLRSIALAPQYFGEGATLFQGKIFQLTYQSQTAFVYDAATFAPLGQFFYPGEGWGLTHDDRYLVMSNGTNEIRFVDPATFQTVQTISVHDSQGAPIVNINELEYINGEIYANIWLTDWIARIDAASGLVVGWIDFTGLRPAGASDVFNGIAYDELTGHLLVTGKFWPSLFEVRVTGGATASPDGTTVPSATQIIDNSGGIWTIASSNLVILRNGATVLGWQGTKILWKGSTVYVLGLDTNWWQWGGSSWVNVGPTMPGNGGTTSSDGTTVPSATQIIDNSGGIWTIASSNLVILRNGATVLGWQGTKILWKGSTVYVLGLDSNWWQWGGSSWVNVGPTMPGSGSTPSPDGTMVPMTAAQIVDSTGAVWTIASNLVILRNEEPAFGWWQGTKILWKGSTIYVLGLDNNWWQWTGSGWSRT